MKFLKRAVLALGGATALAVLLVAGGYGASELIIRRAAPAAQGVARAATDPGAPARGHKVAVVNGCTSCHGADLQGALFHDEPLLIRGYAPNLTFAAARYTDAELDAAIRKGVAPGGRPLWVMPSSAFAYMPDADASDLLAYIRSVPLGGQEQPDLQLGPLLRAAVLLGKLESEPDRLARNAGREPMDAGPGTAEGRRISRVCIECHGPTLDGEKLLGAPDLVVAGAYDEAGFEKLMRFGTAADGRKIQMMASNRFAALTAPERAALLAYLKARSARKAEAAAQASPTGSGVRHGVNARSPIVLCAGCEGASYR